VERARIPEPALFGGISRPFCDKLVGHVRAGDVLAAILLVDSRSDTRCFHQAARSAQRVCFTFGRLKFVQPGGDAESPVSGSALFYFGPDTEVFEPSSVRSGSFIESRLSVRDGTMPSQDISHGVNASGLSVARAGRCAAEVALFRSDGRCGPGWTGRSDRARSSSSTRAL
jgi:hypothetical protein